VATSRWALLALVTANLIPLGGVTVLGWRLYDVMLLYWLENAVVGLFVLARMATAGRARVSAVLIGPFFVIHYGLFWLVHGVFVVALFSGQGPFSGGAAGVAGSEAYGLGIPLPITGRVPLFHGAGLALLGLVASHGVSFVQNWLRGGERAGIEPRELMQKAYGRVVILHVTLLFGGFAVMMIGAPLAALALMVVLKIGVDLAAHLREHSTLREHAERSA